MRIETTYVRLLSPDLYAKVYSLNLRKKGYGRGHIRDCYHQQHMHSLIITAHQKERLMGWALMVQCLDGNENLVEYSTNFYVRKSARGQGVGGELFAIVDETLKMDDCKAHVCIWSKDSERFYTHYTSPRIRVITSSAYKALQS